MVFVRIMFIIAPSSYGWYFTFVQGWVYLALMHLQGFTAKQMVNPWKTYVKLSTSSSLTKGALAFLNYPAQIMFKSTKVLPVMVMGAFIPGLRRRYPLHEYVSAISQDLVHCSSLLTEMLFCSTAVGLPFLIPPMILTGELFVAWIACWQHPYVYGVLVLEAMATYVGQVSVLSLIAFFGAATTAMVTTARKAVTLLLSYLIFTKPLTLQHSIGLLLIFSGICLKMMPDYRYFRPKRTSPTPKINNDQEAEEDRPLV
ncbi:hypothetical protein Leryth_024796 [Lithospermum erythrorhizon]|nr:hypothetical protein Leryth_024796 [Lithospermum erythrorhizon]